MVATWDFKDRLVALEDATMRAEYSYDFTDRRITKRVSKKAAPAPPLSPRVTYPYTTIYVGKHFEVREFDAPTKYIFNGDTRVARVTGTLSPDQRVQRLRVHAGWNLLSVAVTAANGGAQLAATGQTDSIHRWDPEAQSFALVLAADTLSAGTVLWVKASASATLRVMGTYPGPRPNLRAPPHGEFLPSRGLEVLPLTSPPTTLTAWRFAPEAQTWQTKLSLPSLSFSDLPPALAPQEAVYAKAPEGVDLEQLDPALSLRYYHQDHLGSSSVMSDGVGRLVEESANYPFGSPRSGFRPRGLVENYQFTQKERDGESGLDYFEARFMVGGFGRFNRVDPLANAVAATVITVPQRLNTYSYGRSNPFRFVDPTGLIDVDLSLDGVFSLASGVVLTGIAVAAAPVLLTGGAVAVTAAVVTSGSLIGGGAAIGYGLARLSGAAVFESGSKESQRFAGRVGKAEKATDLMVDALTPSAWPGRLAQMAVLDGVTGTRSNKESGVVKDVVDGLVSVRGLVRGKFDANAAHDLLKATKSLVGNLSPDGLVTAGEKSSFASDKPAMQLPTALRREASRESYRVSGNDSVEVPKLIEARRVSY
jgi:RHS repeat-associated protein